MRPIEILSNTILVSYCLTFDIYDDV